MSVPTVLINSVATVITATAMGYYSATLEPHIRGVSLSTFIIRVRVGEASKLRKIDFARNTIIMLTGALECDRCRK